MTLDFVRLKGAKSTRDTLDEVVSPVLILWIQTAYMHGASVSLARRGAAGLPEHRWCDVFRCYLDAPKVHTTRYSFALLMQAIGAKLTDIQKLLLHSNAATTGLYLETIADNQNQFIGKLTVLRGRAGWQSCLRLRMRIEEFRRKM